MRGTLAVLLAVLLSPRVSAAAPGRRDAPASQPRLAMRLDLRPEALGAPPAPEHRALLPAPIRKPAPGPESPFVVDLRLDVPVIVGGLIAAGIPTGLALTPSTETQVLALQAGRVNRMDRGVIGNHSAAAGHASDALLASAVTLPFAAAALDLWISHPPDGWRGFGRDSVVLAETFAVSAIAVTVVKAAVRRPRPYAYDGSLPLSARLKTDASLSFYSGHTSWAFAMATAYSYLYTLRHQGSPWVPVVWVSTESAAAVTGLMRVLAGQHFWSDVIAGAAVGTATGLLIPWLHRRRRGRGARDGWGRFVRDVRVAPLTARSGGGLTALFTW